MYITFSQSGSHIGRESAIMLSYTNRKTLFWKWFPKNPLKNLATKLTLTLAFNNKWSMQWCHVFISCSQTWCREDPAVRIISWHFKTMTAQLIDTTCMVSNLPTNLFSSTFGQYSRQIRKPSFCTCSHATTHKRQHTQCKWIIAQVFVTMQK